MRGAMDSQLGAPDPALRISVVVPARNERDEIDAWLRGLAGQLQTDGSPVPPNAYEVILLANNCDDGTAEAARALSHKWPRLRFHVAELNFDPTRAHVGSARRLLMDTAAARLTAVGQGGTGIIATTDADTVVSPVWLANTLRAFAAPGVMAVGGYISSRRESHRELHPHVQARSRNDVNYKMLAVQLEESIDPSPFNPWPRHYFFNGASLAVRVSAYLRAGGLPELPAHEDVEFHRRLESEDLPIRHDLSVRVATSARRHGRVPEGMSVTLKKWDAEIRSGRVPLFVEPVASIRFRAEFKRRLRALWESERVGRNLAEALREIAVERGLAPEALGKAWGAAGTSFGAKCECVFGLARPLGPAGKVPVEEAISELRGILCRAPSFGR